MAVTIDTVDQFENPAHLGVTCTPEFMLTRQTPLFEVVDKLSEATRSANESGQGRTTVQLRRKWWIRVETWETQLGLGSEIWVHTLRSSEFWTPDFQEYGQNCTPFISLIHRSMNRNSEAQFLAIFSILEVTRGKKYEKFCNFQPKISVFVLCLKIVKN